MKRKRIVLGLAALAVSTVVGIPVLVHHRCQVDERRALDEILRFGIETRAFAFDLNHQGYVSPARLVQPSHDQPSVRLLPGRFLLEERGGYRFTFEGRDGEPESNRPWRVSPAYRGFTYSATPAFSSCAKRSYLLSSATMAVHMREDGEVPTTEDPVLKRLDGARIAP